MEKSYGTGGIAVGSPPHPSYVIRSINLERSVAAVRSVRASDDVNDHLPNKDYWTLSKDPEGSNRGVERFYLYSNDPPLR